jgi:hypothetical protein
LLGFDILADIVFKNIICHPEFAARVECFFGKKETISAVKIADGARGLG